LHAPDRLWIDVDAFTEQADLALRTEDAEAGERALALYEGDLLIEDPYEDWCASPREQLHKVRCDLLRLLARLYEAHGDAPRSLVILEQLVAADPLDEEAYRRLMRLLAAMGDRHRAGQQFQRCCQFLREELDAEPEPATRALYEQILAGQLRPPMAAPETVARARAVLPRPVTSFVGRRDQILEVRQRLAATPLVTLTGMGGIGKTRLALEVVRDAAADYADGIWFVELAAQTDPALVAQAVAEVVGVVEQPGRTLLEAIGDWLADTRGLLVLDNCEHLLAECAAVADALLQACPELRLLATSREPLGVPGEALWPIRTLSVPDPNSSLAVEDLAEYEATRLFLERAALHRPDFSPTERTAAAISELCRRLDGLPLATELAAARVRFLTVEQILTHLDDRFRLLGEGNKGAVARHETMRSAIDWSYELLDERERALFARLAVFVGGWTLEAAEAVCADEYAHDGDVRVVTDESIATTQEGVRQPSVSPISVSLDRRDVLGILAHLVDKSLVIAEMHGDEARYRMLETIRAYAQEKLIAGHEAIQLARRHRDWFAWLVGRTEQALCGPAPAAWLSRLEADHDNLRAALRWSLQETDESDVCLRLADDLGRFWSVRGYLTEGSQWLEAALAHGTRQPTIARGKALARAAHLALLQGDHNRANALMADAMDLQRGLGDRKDLGRTLALAGDLMNALGESDLARARFEESLELGRELHDWFTIGLALNGLGQSARRRGELDKAEAFFRESLSIQRDNGHRNAVSLSLIWLGQVALQRGNVEQARRYLDEGVEVARELGNPYMLAYARFVTGEIALKLGAYAQALALYQEALTTFKELHAADSGMMALEAIACALAALGRPDRAMRLAGAVSRHLATTRAMRWAVDQSELERYIEPALKALGTAKAEKALTEGGAMTTAQAIEYGLLGD
jgi:non-specific serine/threonine protein kinase